MTKGYWKAVVATLSMLLMFGTLTHSGDLVNEKEYGNCMVWTSIDELTDAVSHELFCYDLGGLLELLNPKVVTLRWKEEGTTVAFKTGDLMFLEDFSSIPVVFRIDKGIVREGKWHWSSDGMSAVTWDQTVFDILLKELPGGKRIVFKVGEEKGIVTLNGSARAVRDFRSRISKATAR